MPPPNYTYTGPIDHTTVPNLANAKGKSVIVTGGANGMGKVTVRAFGAAGAFVTLMDCSGILTLPWILWVNIELSKMRKTLASNLQRI